MFGNLRSAFKAGKAMSWARYRARAGPDPDPDLGPALDSDLVSAQAQSVPENS